MGIIAPKGGTCGAAGPLSDRSCLNLEREDSFYYPLPAADIWGHLLWPCRRAGGASGGRGKEEVTGPPRRHKELRGQRSYKEDRPPSQK